MNFQDLGMIIENIYHILQQVFSIVLTVCLGVGIISGPSKDSPATFQDNANCEMSFVALADTHVRDTAINPYYIENGFKDMAAAEGEFDALVIAGDISELGDGYSYDMFWDKIDESMFGDKPVLMATGNHDVRILYNERTQQIIEKTEEHLGMEIDKPYYSYDVEGYTFVVLGSDKRLFEKAYISDKQLSFLDSELERGTREGKPVFVVCHQPLENTHGLPEVWEKGGIGEQSEQVKQILMKYENVFFLNGHLHDGIYEKSLEVFDEEKGVYSINLPAYGKENDYGPFSQQGLGVYVETYSDRVVFTARDFFKGNNLDGYTYTFYLK